MDRVEALRVLHEILKTLEQLRITFVSIDEITSSSNSTIRIGSSLDSDSRENINPILDKHGLAMKENIDSIVIYSA